MVGAVCYGFVTARNLEPKTATHSGCRDVSFMGSVFQLMGVDLMASLSKEAGRDSWKLSWYEGAKRKAIRLGGMPKKTAGQFLVKFEELLGVRRGGGSMPQALGEWAKGLDAELRKKLEGLGLLECKRRLTLGGLCDEYKASRTNVAPATTVRDRQVCALLTERFGADRLIESITVRDAEEWVRWLAAEGNKRDSERQTLQGNTVRRRTGTARQIFATAIRWELLKGNPFDGLATTVRENRERQEFVTWQNILKVIKVAPTLEWKALIAFVRLVGPRVPSELVGLTWADVDLVSKRIVIKSPKTKHHGGEHAVRSCPIFPELVPYLEKLSESVGPGVMVPLSSPVFPVACGSTVNLRTAFSRLIVLAGLSVWPKLFVNLRSSRETELLAVYPVADVCRWFGHSPAVAARFYAQSRSEVADRAANESTLKVDEKADNDDDLAGTKMGTISDETGTKTGSITGDQESSIEHHKCLDTQGKHGRLMARDVKKGLGDGTLQWTILDSNQRPPRCQRGALTN